MPRFVFKLKGVLRQRVQIEEQRQRDLAQAREQAAQVEQELRTLSQSMRTTLEEVRAGRLTGKLDLHFLAAHRRYTASMQQKAQLLAQRLAAMQPLIEARRLALVEAAKRRKAIEKLRERRKEQWLGEQSRLETADLDEVSGQMFFAERSRDAEPESAA